MERKFVLAVVAFLNRQCTVVGHRRLRNEILIGREIGIDIVELRSGCEKCLKITHGACHGTGIQKNIPNGENAVQSPGADHKVRSEIGKERKQRVFPSVMAEKRAKSRYIGRKCSMAFPNCTSRK